MSSDTAQSTLTNNNEALGITRFPFFCLKSNLACNDFEIALLCTISKSDCNRTLFYKCYPNRKDRTPKQIDKILLSEWSICAFITTRIATLKTYVGTYLTFKSFGYILLQKRFTLLRLLWEYFSTLGLYNSTWELGYTA